METAEHSPACGWPYERCSCEVAVTIFGNGDYRQGDWMQTFKGKAFYPLDPRPEDIDSEDIAHALSMLCRYNGHTKYFYSVAEHCVHVSRWCESMGNAYTGLWGLLHDATEAYVGDMVRPLKRSMPDYKEAETRIMASICIKFGLDSKMPEIVKEADNRILADERDKLMGKPPKPWVHDEAGIEGLGVDIACWTPAKARDEYWTQLVRLLQVIGGMPR